MFAHYDDIVIDGPPRVNELARAAINSRRRSAHPCTAVTVRCKGSKGNCRTTNEASVLRKTGAHL